MYISSFPNSFLFLHIANPHHFFQIMKNTLRILTRLFTLPLLGLFTQAAEQDNWYLAKSFDVSSARSVFLDMNESGKDGLIYVARGEPWDGNSQHNIQVYDFNGTLINTFGSGSFMDITMDSNGTIYVAANNSVRAFSKSSGRVVSVTVDHPGSRYYRYWSNNEFYLEFAGGGGSGTSAYAMMEENSSISSIAFSSAKSA